MLEMNFVIDQFRLIIGTASLSAGLVALVIWIARNWFIERLAGSIRHEYATDLETHKAALKSQFDSELEVRKAALKAQSDAELEVHKANLQRGFHVQKAQFDMEFSSFQKLWGALSLMVDETGRLINLYEYSETPEGKGTKRKHAEDADKAFFAATRVVQDLEPFIPEDVYQKSKSLYINCKTVIDDFFGVIKFESEDTKFDISEYRKDARASGNDIRKDWHEIANLIRVRLKLLTMPGS